jgi:hypothetical protein
MHGCCTHKIYGNVLNIATDLALPALPRPTHQQQRARRPRICASWGCCSAGGRRLECHTNEHELWWTRIFDKMQLPQRRCFRFLLNERARTCRHCRSTGANMLSLHLVAPTATAERRQAPLPCSYSKPGRACAWSRWPCTPLVAHLPSSLHLVLVPSRYNKIYIQSSSSVP